LAPIHNFDSIYRLYYEKVFRLCKGYFNGDNEIAADATQEVFIKVWQHLATFRDESSISTWIYRIASNTCLMYIRKRLAKKEIHVEVLPDVVLDNDTKDKEARLNKMYDCISKLEPTNKLLIMMVLESLPYEEIAGIVGITEENLRVRIHRIKIILTKCVTNGKF
jgi:RNA polymerase sigma factor (sigma-70 family)